MNESQPSCDRDRIAAGAEKYRQRQAEEFLEAFDAWEADKEKAQPEAPAEPSADGDPDDTPSNDLSDGRDAAGAADQLAWLLAAEDNEDFVSRVFQDFGDRLLELMCRIVVVLESGRLDAGRRQALLERIAFSGELLVDLADPGEPSSGSDGLPPLEGSTKQVAWAEQLRGELIHEVERAGDLDLVDRIRAVRSAAWFIAARDHPLETIRDSLGG
jgi:hypothetical protein